MNHEVTYCMTPRDTSIGEEYPRCFGAQIIVAISLKLSRSHYFSVKRHKCRAPLTSTEQSSRFWRVRSLEKIPEFSQIFAQFHAFSRFITQNRPVITRFS